jgi:hypothetical protein
MSGKGRKAREGMAQRELGLEAITGPALAVPIGQLADEFVRAGVATPMIRERYYSRPGWLRTDMADAKARLSIEESIPNLADTHTHRPEKRIVSIWIMCVARFPGECEHAFSDGPRLFFPFDPRQD